MIGVGPSGFSGVDTWNLGCERMIKVYFYMVKFTDLTEARFGGTLGAWTYGNRIGITTTLALKDFVKSGKPIKF